MSIKDKNDTTLVYTTDRTDKKMRKKKVITAIDKKRWIHYVKNGHEMICGKHRPHGQGRSHTAHDEFEMTTILNVVTCPRCVELLKDKFWYCSFCGFIVDECVTYKETCNICGELLR